VAISTPAIRAFARAVEGGAIDIQELSAQVNDIQTKRLTKLAAVETTSGTFKDVTGIPSWTKVIKVYLNGISSNGASPFILQLGSGTPETTGYNSTGSSGSVPTTATSGLLLSANMGAAIAYTGSFDLVNISGNTWLISGTSGGTGQSLIGSILSGNKTLESPLSSIRLTTIGGTDVFDAGSFCVTYEGQVDV
jgi:hypothetical protein